MHQPALDQRVGSRLERLRAQLVGDKPAVGADVEQLQGGAAVGGDGGQRRDHGGVAQRPRCPRGRLGPACGLDATRDPGAESALDADTGQQRARVGAGAIGGDGPCQGVLGGRFGRRVDDPGEVADPDDRRLDRVGGGAVGSRRQQGADIVEQGRARLGAAVLVAVSVGEKEALAGQRQADAEQVALLGLAVAPGLEPERTALGFGQEGVAAAIAAGELAVLQGADEDVVEAPGAQPVGAGDPHPSLDRAAPDPELQLGDRRCQLLRAGRQGSELRQLGQGVGDRSGGAQLEPVARRRHRAVVAATQRPRRHRRRQPSDRGRQRRRRALRRFAQPHQVARRLALLALPQGQGRLHVLDPAPPQRALEPVDPAGGGARRPPQVAQQVTRPPRPELGLQQRHQGAADRGAGDLQLRLQGGRHPVRLEGGGDRRPAPGRVAQGDRDLVRVGAAGEQLRDLGCDRFRLAPGPGRAQQGQALVRLARLRPRRAEFAGELEEQGTVGVAAVGRGRRLLGDPDSLPQLAQQPRPCRQRRVPLFVGKGDGYLGQRRQRRDQVELVRREVVEPVEEERAPAPEGAVAPQRRDRLAGDPVGVDPAAALAGLGVAGEEGGEVAEVGGALEGRGAGRDRVGLDPGRLQLVEQPLEGARRSPAARQSAAAARAGRGWPRPRPRSPAVAAPPRARPPAAPRPRWRRCGTGPRRSSPPRPAPTPRRRARARRRRRRRGWARPGPDRCSRAAVNRRRTRPARPEFGGPWIRFSGIAASDPA